MLRTHYRQPIDWTLARPGGKPEGARPLASTAGDPQPWHEHDPRQEKLLEPLSDDLNAPLAITAIHQMAEEAADDREGDERGMPLGAQSPRAAAGPETDWRRLAAGGHAHRRSLIDRLIAERAAARSGEGSSPRPIACAPRSTPMGVVLKDGPEGTTVGDPEMRRSR